MIKYLKMFFPILVGIVIYLFPVPEGLNTSAWIYFSVFMTVVVGLIIEPIPAALVGLIGVVLLVWFKIGPVGSAEQKISSAEAIKWGLAGFSNSTVWLIFVAFMFGLGYEKSGLGKRVALLLVKALGKTTLGLGYAISIADGILAPFVPSNSARSGGMLYPIVISIPPMMGSYPNSRGEARKIGSYLVWVSLAATCVTSSMFFTALAPNLLAMETAIKSGATGVSWFGWFIAFAPCGILLFILTPLLTYWIYPPEIKGSKEAPEWAKKELEKMGSMAFKEYLMIALAVFALVFWIGGKTFGVNATTVALSVMVLMVLFGIINWNDLLSNKSAWGVLAWFGSLVTLAGGLKNVGFLEWVARVGGEYLSHFDPMVTFVGLIIFFYVLHYFFASTTAHVTALLGLFIAVAGSISGIDVNELTLFLMLSLGIMGIITPYGTGPSPVWYGSGYVSSSDFWRLGFIFGAFYLIVFLVVCIPWVKYFAYQWI